MCRPWVKYATFYFLKTIETEPFWLNNASCEHMFLYSLCTVFLELESLKYPQGILRRALYDIGTRYVIVRQYVRVVAQWNARRWSLGKLLFASREMKKMCVLIPESVSVLQSDLSGLLHAYFEFLKKGHLNFVVVREITASISSHVSQLNPWSTSKRFVQLRESKPEIGLPPREESSICMHPCREKRTNFRN